VNGISQTKAMGDAQTMQPGAQSKRNAKSSHKPNQLHPSKISRDSSQKNAQGGNTSGINQGGNAKFLRPNTASQTRNGASTQSGVPGVGIQEAMTPTVVAGQGVHVGSNDDSNLILAVSNKNS
jgi:hypothetical protein